VRRLRGVVARESFDLTLSALAALLGQEAQRAVARVFKLQMDGAQMK